MTRTHSSLCSPEESFGQHLRRCRISSRQTMGQVARALGITVVYYSEVEGGKKAAFPEKKVDYLRLSEVLQTPLDLLRERAQSDRQQRRLLKSWPEEHTPNKDLAVAFGRRLFQKNLSEKQIQKIRKILNEVE